MPEHTQHILFCKLHSAQTFEKEEPKHGRTWVKDIGQAVNHRPSIGDTHTHTQWKDKGASLNCDCCSE